MFLRLDTQRVLLTTPAPSMAQAVLAYQLENREFLKPFEARKEDDFFTLSTQKALLREERRMCNAAQSLDFWIMHKMDAKIIGKVVVFSILTGNFSMCMVGYKLHCDYVNQGYMSEALARVVRFAFETLGLHRIEANILPDNYPSRRVVEKLGFSLEGTSRLFANIDGQWRDHVRYALLNPAQE